MSTGKNDKFKENLLRKRRTYARYFERGLRHVDDALRRVAVFRGGHGERVVQETAVDRSGVSYETGYTIRILTASSEIVAQMKQAVAGSRNAKEKTALKKYALRCVSRGKAVNHRFGKRLLNWEETQKKREKEERAWNWGLKLREVQHFYDSGGRQPSRRESLLTLPVFGPAPSLRAVRYVVAGPIPGSVGTSPPFYFDEAGNRVRFGSLFSVVG